MPFSASSTSGSLSHNSRSRASFRLSVRRQAPTGIRTKSIRTAVQCLPFVKYGADCVRQNCRLGVDIEKMRSEVDTVALAERFFSLRERAGLRALPDDLRVQGFFACWTRKEAFLKATGDGFSFPLADFSVTTRPDLEPSLEEIRGDTQARKQWVLVDIEVRDGYRAAVAVDHAFSQMKTYAWN